MPPTNKPVQVTPDQHWVDYEGTKIEIPKPLSDMTEGDWIRLATGKKSSLGKVSVNNQSFLGLHVVLKDKAWIPLWLYAGRGSSDIPKAFDSLERSISMGAQLVSSLDDIKNSQNFRLSADGHIHRDDVILAKMPAVVYWAMVAQNLRKSKTAIEYQSVEGKAYENVDMPHYVKGNRQVPLYEATEHAVEYQDRPRF